MPLGILIIMANSNNSAGITSDDIQKAKDYADAMDKLKSSINGVNSTLPKFSDGLEAGLKAMAEKLPEVIESMTKLNAQNRELAANGQQPVSVLSQLASSMFSWNNLVSVGITLLVTYGSTIIKWVGDMIKGETTLSAFTKAMKDNALITEALIQTKLNGNKAAQGELASLTALYNATQNQTRDLQKQKEAVKALKEQWPETFKNLSDETIMAGKAAKSYKDLKDQITAASIAEAAKTRITTNAGRMIDNEQKIANERAKNLKIIKDQVKAEIKMTDYTDEDAYALALAEGNKALHNQTTLREASDKVIYDLTTDTKLLTRQNDQLYKSIEDNVKKLGVSVLYKVKPEENTPNLIPKKQNQDNEPLQLQKQHATELLEAKSITFNKQIELDKQAYETEQQLLTEQLNKKLISQQQYDEQSSQLQEKFHLAIGKRIEHFNAQDFETAKKHMQDMVDAQDHENVIEKDKKNIKKAILPTDQLAAEKKLIDDKYNYEIQKAQEAGKDTTEIRTRYEQEITEVSKRYEEQRKDFALQMVQQVSEKAFSILQNNIKSSSDSKIKQLETQKQAELSNTNLTTTQKQAIEDKYKKKEAAEKQKAFKADQKVSILQAVINGALAITKVTSQTGVLSPFVIPAIIAETAIQVATIAAQKAPQYAKGGLHYQSDGKGALLPGYSRTDNTNAYLRSGEAVVVSEAMRNPWARNLVSAINVAHGGRDFSLPNTGKGYAIGGIFTDGGNSNRYYSQPMNDVKDLANTLAYQMINNFPPVYVDVKDINTQQNILAQTVDRVNL